MSKFFKYALIFTSGAAVGFGVCGVKVLDYAISDDDLREGLKRKISKRVNELLFGEERPHKHSDKIQRSVKPVYYLDIVFESREKAEKLKQYMQEMIALYGVISVADAYEEACSIGNTVGICTDGEHGWTDVTKAGPIRVREGYILELPEPIEID